MSEQATTLVVVTMRGIAPGVPTTLCQEMLREALEGQLFSSPDGNVSFTVTVDGFASEAEVRCFPLSRTII